MSSWTTRCCDVHDDLAMQRRDAAFREAFRRCGGILPRIVGVRSSTISPWTRDDVKRYHAVRKAFPDFLKGIVS